MSLDYPANPVKGQTYTSANGTVWVFDGAKWTSATGAGPQPCYIGPSPPTGVPPGTMWWDTVSGNLFIWFNDGNSTQWVVAVNQIGAYLATTGGQMTGPLILNADPTQPLGASTKQYVDNSAVAVAGDTMTGPLVAPSITVQTPPAGDNSSLVPTTAWENANAPSIASGFVNKLRNGTFDIWQRGTSFSSGVGAFTFAADGWLVSAAGAAVTAAAAGSRQLTLNSMQITGAAGNTTTNVWQRIESYVAMPLGGQNVTFQIWVYNNTGATITPSLNLMHANVRDTWPGSPVADFSGNLQPCPNGAWTRCAITGFLPVASAALGIVVLLSFNALPSGSVYITEADLRATPGWPVGLCANPPPPELRPFPIEMTFCQRYYEIGYAYGSYPGATGVAPSWFFYVSGLTSGANYAGNMIYFRTAKRVPPTMTAYSSNSGASGRIYSANSGADVACTIAAATSGGCYCYATLATASTTINFQGQWTASAEL